MKIKYIDDNDELHIFNSDKEFNDYLITLTNFSLLSDSRLMAEKLLSRVKSIYKDIPKQKALALKMMDSGGTYYIKFLKVDGVTIREMICTRDWRGLENTPGTNYIAPKESGTRSQNQHQVIVWDLGNQAFRSFRDSQLLDIKKLSSDIITHYNFKIKMGLEYFKDLLDNGELTITYKKLDGSTRLMRCTRKILDFDDKSVGSKITVWDLDKEDYRNIIFENIQKINKISPTNKARIRNLFK